MVQDLHQKVAPIEEIIQEARSGRPYILVDAEDRENEGDIIFPAQFATPENINFMAVHARGLICLALTQERAQALRLPPMTAQNDAALGTAFTVSIEAREGVTTGISAHDRAHTVRVAIDTNRGPDDLVRPGHVFLLVARDGGVLTRAGHTEAAVDISRLAGLQPAGVICEILNDDGSMARLPELLRFADRHGLKVGTIADLIAFRRRHERQVVRVLEQPFDTIYGQNFRLVVFRNTTDQVEHVALVHAGRRDGLPAMVRMHQVDLTVDMLGHAEARQEYIPKVLRAIAAYDGPGIAVSIRDPDPMTLSNRLGRGYQHYQRGSALRDYGVGAQILLELGVHDLILLTSSAMKPVALEGCGLRILERRPIE